MKKYYEYKVSTEGKECEVWTMPEYNKTRIVVIPNTDTFDLIGADLPRQVVEEALGYLGFGLGKRP